ncbi:MAG: N-acetylneuraminate synthase family protein [Spirochaetia bacterium]|nr:N-acetylneuraminate synthase family protein [Spirochaetia bacterium]
MSETDGFFSLEISSTFSNKKISKNALPYLTAEIGLNHNNDIELGKKLISEAKKNGADGVKFQSYSTDLFIDSANNEVKFLYNIFKAYELDYKSHEILKQTANDEGIDFFSTPLSIDWIEPLLKLQIPFYKIASGDINNFQLISKVIQTQKPLILSTGSASISEIEKIAEYLKINMIKDCIFLHCVSIYPTPFEKLNLINISYLEKKLKALIGFSDHSIGEDAAFAAVSSGAVLIEKHFTIDNNLPGPDQKLSATPEILKKIREKINKAYYMKGEKKQNALSEELKSDFFGKRSLYEKNGQFIALRPRVPHLPKDSDYIEKNFN